MKLETERLILRPINIEDKAEIFNYRSDVETNKYQGWIPKTYSDVDIFIGKLANVFNEPETWFQFVIIEKHTQKIVGDLGVHFLDKENKQSEIGCTLSKDFQNRGYAFEAVKSVIYYLFNNLNKHRITASIDPDNVSSRKLVEKLGFRMEAHFVESLFINGKWCDDLVYALLKKHWEKIE